MIFVSQQPEPKDFDTKVRQPGNQFLQNNPNVKPKDMPRLWRLVLFDLWKAYNGVCAYSCHWFPPFGGESVDHFFPKSTHRNLVYEWSNYRLATMTFNTRKDNNVSVVDPFRIGGNWFVLVFPAMLVKPNPQESEPVRRQVKQTIDLLKLNEEAIVNVRLDYILEYCDGDITLNGLWRKAPLIAHELVRQNLTERVQQMMGRRTTQVIPN